MKQAAEVQTRCWLERFVLAHNLCPFARRPWQEGRVRVVVSTADSEWVLLQDLLKELQHLASTPPVALETTLLIHPQVLKDFYDYNDFLEMAEDLLLDEGYEGEFQLASFHPDYQFAGSDLDDVGNFTNRSPHPMLHILREESVSAAVDSHPDIAQVPEQNLRRMECMGKETLEQLLQRCKTVWTEIN